jgi:predicted dehydrogenase
MGDALAPKLDTREALAVECEHFRDCVRQRRTPWTSAGAGLRVVRILEAAARSLAEGGTRVAV